MANPLLEERQEALYRDNEEGLSAGPASCVSRVDYCKLLVSAEPSCALRRTRFARFLPQQICATLNFWQHRWCSRPEHN
jgi:hypothetical protein